MFTLNELLKHAPQNNIILTPEDLNQQMAKMKPQMPPAAPKYRYPLEEQAKAERDELAARTHAATVASGLYQMGAPTTWNAVKGGVSDVLNTKAGALTVGNNEIEHNRAANPMPAGWGNGLLTPEQKSTLYKAIQENPIALNKDLDFRKAVVDALTSGAKAIDPGKYEMPTSAAGRLAHDVVRAAPYSISSMAVNAPISIALGAAGAVAGGVISSAMEAADERGHVYRELRAKGLGHEEAYKLSDPVHWQNMGALSASNIAQNLLTFAGARLFPGVSPVMRTVGAIGADAGIEGLEEMLQGVISSKAKSEKINPRELAYEGLIGGLSGALFGGGGALINEVAERRAANKQAAEQAAVQNTVQAKQAEILEDIQRNRKLKEPLGVGSSELGAQVQRRGELFGISEQLPQQSQIIEPVVNVDLLPQQPKEQMQEQQPTVSETESVQKPKLPPKEVRKELVMWGREKMQELSAPAEFVDGEEQARNPLSDEDLQTYSDIRRALKVNDYGKLAELKAGFDTQQQEAQAEQIQKPDNIVDANEMIEQEQMQEQMQAPVKQQQETNNIINFFNAAGKDMQEQRQYGDGIETDNIVNFNTLEEQAKAEDERLEAESKADAAKRIQEKITDEARDKRNARLVNAIKTKQKDATLGEIGVWIEALPDDEVSAFAGEIIRKQPAGVKKAAINRLNERIEQVKAQESAEQRTAKISVDDISSLQFADESSMGKDDYELNRITGVTYQRQKEASAKRAQNIEELKARKDEPSTREEYEEREKARQGRGKELPIGEYLEREGRPEGEKITPQDRLNYAKYCLKNGYTPDLQTIEPLITEYTKRREVGQKKAEPTPTRAASTPSVPSANVVLREGSITDAELSGISDAEYEVLKSRRDAQASKKADREARALPGGVAGQAGQEHLYRSAGWVTEQGSTYLDYLQDRGKTDSVQSRLDYVKERRGLGGFYEKAVADSVRTSDARKRTEEQILKKGGNTGGAVSAAAVKTQGKESRVSTQAGDSVNTRFKVVEADDLIASHNEAFGENENYPQELQPRKRGRAASQHQVEHIISNLNPELLGDSKLASDGAPIIGSDNIVESGNGRVLALKLAYGRGQATEKQAQKYRQYLSDNAEQFGLSAEDISSMKKPVLVRERTSDVDRKSFAQNANVSSVATMSSSETALKDADKLDVGMLESINTDLDVLSSKDFINTFARDVVPKNELGTFMDSKGNLSQDGMRRAKNALFVKAYGDEQTLARMSESTDDNTRNISRALLQASTAVAPVQAKIKDGLIRKDLSMAEHIIQAANTLSSLRDKGMKVSEFLQQGNIFDEGGISPEARQILQFFDKNKQKPNVITNYLKDTARRVAAEGDGNQGSLFGGKPKSLNDILRSAESEATPKQKGLWDDIKKREFARKYIIDDATKQLKATGMEQSEIDSNVALMTAVFETFAEREGIGADELYKLYDIEFRKGDRAKGEDPNKVVMEVRNQEASHGSPHDFDGFDFSFMGTGEGAQAFGWGGYFGQDRKMLDKYYRERLSSPKYEDWDGAFISGSNGDKYRRNMKSPGWSREDAKGNLHEVENEHVINLLEGVESGKNPQTLWEELLDLEKELKELKEKDDPSPYFSLSDVSSVSEAVRLIGDISDVSLRDKPNRIPTGQLYDVEIPDDHELLLWDKPMGEQPDVVKKALEKDSEEEVRRFESTIASYLDEIKNKGGEEAYELAKKIIYGDRSEWDSESSEKARVNYTRLKQLIGNLGIYENTKEDDFLASLVKEAGFSMPEENKVEELAREHNKEIKQPKLTGQEFYYSLSEKLGSDKAASLWLNDHGIKGHKFLDGNSRSSGEGTYNFVIYDDKAIEIKKKYYQDEQETAAERVNIVDIKDIPFIETSRRSNSGKTTYVDKKIKVSELPGNIQAIVKKKYRKNESPEFVDDKEVAAAIESANRKIIKEASESKLVKNFHKQGDIAFQSLSIPSLGMVQKLRIHKSANHNRAQSSEYYVGIINNRLVYIRKSNHWGHFSTNVYESDNNPAYAGVEGDEFGRVGSKFHNWELKGADLTVSGEYKKISQAGFVYLDEYHQNEKGTGLHQKSVDKDTPRGSIEFSKNLGTGEISTVINFTALQDKSTCVHELGHLYYKLLADQARRMPDNPEVQTAFAMAREFLGTEDGQGALTGDQQEKWANGWMNYVAEGKAPNAKLESVFKRFKKWLADLWANMTGRKDKVELTEGIRQVFDWLLTGDAAFDVRYDLDNALALAAEAEKFERLEQEGHKQQTTSNKTKSGVEVFKKTEDKRNYSGIMDIFNSPNIVADRHPRFAVFYRMAKDAYAKQERLRNNWQRAANKIFGKKGYISNQADRESLTEILLTGDALGRVFPNEELAQLGADTNIIKAYRQIRGLYDNAHRMVSEQRKKYGKDELAYRKGYVPHFFHAWRVIKDGEIVDSHRSMNDAVKAAERLMESDGGKIKVAPALDDFGGQAQSDAITLGDVQYFKFIQKTADTFAMTLEEARDMTKDIAKMQNRSRVFKNALERKGYPGWDKNMEFALRRYLNLSARYIAMDTLKHDGIRMFERTFGRFKSEHSGLANYTKKFLEDALGHPSKIEDSLNEWVRNSPLSKYVKDYIGDRPATVLANSIAKTVAIAKLGFCNASAAMINVTQLIGTNAIIGEANTFRGLVEYLQPTNKTKSIYEAIGITDDITMENPSGYSGIHRVGGRLGELSMSLFRIMDNMARKVTVLGAYRKATAEGKSHLEALEYARKVNDDVNFDYSVVDTPHFIRQLGPIGTLLFQFKKYPIKQLELALPGVGKLKGKEQLRYWAYASVMSGLFGLPAFEFIKNLIRGLWDDKDIEIEIKDAVTQSGLPQSVKDTLMYGALSNLGIDVGKRVGMGDLIPSGIEDFTGPSISTGIQLIRSLPKIYNNGSIIDTLEALSPGLSNPYKAFVAGETVDKRRGRTKFVYETTGEKLARATGARPIRESKEADAVRSGNYNQRKQSEVERDAIDSFVELYLEKKQGTPEYQAAKKRLGELRISNSRVNAEIEKRMQGSEYQRKLRSQPKTPAGRNRRTVMESYAGLGK